MSRKRVTDSDREIIQQQIKPSRYDHLRKMQIARLEAKIAQWQSILDHLRAQDEQAGQ